MPSAESVVSITGDVNLQIPVGKTLAYGQLNLDGCRLAADCDWRGLAELPTKTDLCGHDLALAALPKSGEITDSSAYDRYDTLDYIESTAQQRITTDIVPGSGTAMDFEFSITRYIPMDRGRSIASIRASCGRTAGWWATSCRCANG